MAGVGFIRDSWLRNMQTFYMFEGSSEKVFRKAFIHRRFWLERAYSKGQGP
jgi:hypothetical protein